MNQNEQIKINFKKENTLSVSGDKFILSCNANKMLDLLDAQKAEINIDLEELPFNISSNSFEKFITASFGNDINFDSQDSFEIQKLCEFYGNNSLLSEINDFIEQIEEPQKAILQFKLDENQDSLKYISNNFPKCAVYDDFMNLDLKYIDAIFSSDDFKSHIKSNEYQHFLARYLVNIREDENKRQHSADILRVIDYSKLLPSDIKDIITYYPDVERTIPDSALSSIKTIHDIISKGNQTLNSIDQNLDNMLKERKDTIKLITAQLESINEEKDNIFKHMSNTRARIDNVESQREYLTTIQKRYEYITDYYNKVTVYQKKIEESLNNLESRISDLDPLSSQIVENSNK